MRKLPVSFARHVVAFPTWVSGHRKDFVGSAPRAIRVAILLHLPGDLSARAVADAMITWNRGTGLLNYGSVCRVPVEDRLHLRRFFLLRFHVFS